MKNRIKNRRRSTKVPTLKSASGAGFTFEDKVAALFFCEMLTGKPSLGADLGIIDRIERQAGDWEPFGDILLTVPNADGKHVKCGCSVKSNRQITANGCDAEMCGSLWNVIAKPVFNLEADAIGLFCAELSKNVSQPLNELCQQARNENNPRRFDSKISDKKHRKIYASFASISISGEKGLPHHILSRLIPREFDFEDATSRDEATAIRLCLEIIQPASSTAKKSRELWKALLDIAQELRITGGSTTRDRLTAKLRNRFVLRDDPSDVKVWENVHALSREWMDQIEARLPGGLTLPRDAEIKALRDELAANRACHVLGESGSGKSALVKALVAQNVAAGAELVWIKAELFSQMRKAAPTFIEAALRVRRSAAFVVIDGIEACYDPSMLHAIAETISTLTADADSPWRIIITCQTPEWSRISLSLAKVLAGKAVLTRQAECGELSKEDFALVCASHASVLELSRQPHLRRILKSPKMLDVLLSGQHAENRALVSEADFVEWWWEQQVRQSKAIAAEETVARQLATRMADELCTELAPDSVAGAEEAATTLIRNRVLYRTRDGRLRFNHDLLADWSRVMCLRSLGGDALGFMRAHAMNPPWLRAIRLLSQHMLERTADFVQWSAVVKTCSTKPKENEEPSAENLQILDPWLEGIVYCADAENILDRLKSELFSNDGWLLRRFVSRLLHVGTIPDPVIQDRFRQMDSTAVETAGTLFRLPQQRLWTPVINFLIQNKTEATDFLPVELADIASMWSRLEEYLQTPWPVLADIILLSGEMELRREVAGEYRHDRGPISLGRGHNSRVKIYTAALQAASQFPDRAAKLLLKAAGRAPWDEGDINEKTREEWRGEWHEHSPLGRWDVYIKEPPESWPGGPNRYTSDDFFHAWFESGMAQILYKKRPDAACEATLALLISWPKTELIKGHEHHGYEVEHRGFTSEASHMYPPFWHKGNFLGFLRQSWRPALEMIIRLVNFATDRHRELYNHAEITIQTAKGPIRWKGNQNVYTWHHFNMQSADVVVCALMAVEKWLDEQLKEGKSVTEAVDLLYEKSDSFASAGLLISLGKRFPQLFARELKPLLFIQHFYICDIHSTRNYFGVSFWPQDGKMINKLQREWSQLPGRKTALKDICLEWLLTKPELADALKEVSTAWRQDAEKLPEGSEDKIVLLRWAADFDRSLWKEVTLPDGREGWSCERPAELQDEKAAERQGRIQHLMTLPYQCSDWLEQGQQFNEAQLDSVWKQLQDWAPFEQLGLMEGESPDSALFRDHRHGRAGLLAILLCAGDSWLEKHSDRRKWLETEVQKILDDPPQIICFSPDEVHDDYESLLARAVIRCWAHSPQDINWRGYVGSFVTAHRYRTVLRLFQEAFKVRQKLGNAYRELEGFALAFAVERKKATQFQFLRTRTQTNAEDLHKWSDKWLRKFAGGKGPKWTPDWSKVESLEAFPNDQRPKAPKSSPRDELHRRDYGLDMGTILAAFGQFPALDTAIDSKERDHWLGVCKQMVAAFCRTLPNADKATPDDAEWHYDHWRSDEEIYKTVARRLFECTSAERRELWEPIVCLPFAAHHHICSFLDQLVIEALGVEPYRIAELIPIWREIANCIFAKPKSKKENWRNRIDVQKHILLYGSVASSSEEFWGPLVENLRPLFKQHLSEIWHDTHDQSSFAYFLTTKAGERLLIDALVWLQPAWELARDYFWERVAEENHFANLLEHAWRYKFADIRANPIALKSFKILTLKLATHHVPIALEVQQQV
jgi:hypothetical protein